MPYKIIKSRGKELYWVVNALTGIKMSKNPIPLERAQKQIKALHIKEFRNKKNGIYW